MDKVQYFKFCISAIFMISMSVQAEMEFSYEKNTFITYNNCLGMYPGTALGLGEKVWSFSVGRSPMIRKVVDVVRAADAQKRFDALGGFKKVYDDKRLWAEIGCAHSFSGDMPELLARLSSEQKDSSDLGFAIRGLPSDVWIAKGSGGSIPMRMKDNPSVGLVRHLVTDACYGPNSLVRVRTFPVRHERAITQLDIGMVKKLEPQEKKQRIEDEIRENAKWMSPEYKKKTLEELEKIDFVDSVEICRFFLDEKRVLKGVNISRSSGEETERAGTVTDLNIDNWADTTDSVIGFISLNEGKDWDVLLVDVGWEGINYSIQRLNGSIVHYDRSLYTYH